MIFRRYLKDYFEFKEAYDSLGSYKAMAKKYFVSVPTIGNIARQVGFAKMNRKAKNVDYLIKRIKALLSAGFNQYQIAEELEVSQGYVSILLRRNCDSN